MASIPIPYLWLLAGAAFLLLEAFGVPGIGLAFAGLGALAVGILLEAGMIGDTAWVTQFSWWFGVTAVTAMLLWKPLQRWRVSPATEGDYQNMIGDTAVVYGGDLIRGKPGKARWSGTIMNARLADDAGVERLEEGADAKIVAVDGVNLILGPQREKYDIGSNSFANRDR